MAMVRIFRGLDSTHTLTDNRHDASRQMQLRVLRAVIQLLLNFNCSPCYEDIFIRWAAVCLSALQEQIDDIISDSKAINLLLI